MSNDNKKDNGLDLIPTGNHIIVKPFRIKKTKSGIIMPNEDSINLSEGRVVRVGESCNKVQVGDYILYGKNVAPEIERGGEVYAILYESSVTCKVDRTISREDDYLVKEEA